MIGDNPASGMNTADVTAFYGVKNDNGVFSNFYSKPIVINGKLYPTSEHYFQARKFAGTDDAWAEQIRATKSAAEAAKMGRKRTHPLRNDWENVKVTTMYNALVAKFTQYTDCRRALLNTGESILVEHTSNDAYWGDGVNGNTIGAGKNALGQLLMRLRDEMRNGLHGGATVIFNEA